MHQDYQDFQHGTDEALPGTFEVAKDLALLIGDTVGTLIGEVRNLDLSVDKGDGAFALEAAVYHWIKRANPDASLFASAEGFGAALSGPSGERVMKQARGADAFIATRAHSSTGDGDPQHV